MLVNSLTINFNSPNYVSLCLFYVRLLVSFSAFLSIFSCILPRRFALLSLSVCLSVCLSLSLSWQQRHWLYAVERNYIPWDRSRSWILARAESTWPRSVRDATRGEHLRRQTVQLPDKNLGWDRRLRHSVRPRLRHALRRQGTTSRCSERHRQRDVSVVFEVANIWSSFDITYVSAAIAQGWIQASWSRHSIKQRCFRRTKVRGFIGKYFRV